MGTRIIVADVLAGLQQLADNSVDVVVCSPPYWGQRDYGCAGQMGMEPTLGEHIAALVEVFREVRRVLKPAGAFWLNYGDCYATTPNGRSAADIKKIKADDRTFRDKPFSTVGPIHPPEPGNPFPNVKRRGGGNNPSGGVLKPKDLCLAPFRLVISLQEDGWWVRSRCMWGKPNAMPDSSGRYRPAVAHEEIFLLGKTGDIKYDFEAVKKPLSASSVTRLAQNVDQQKGSARANAGKKTNGPMRAVVHKPDKQRGHSRRHAGFNDRWDKMTKAEQQENGRLLRTYEPIVWEIATSAFKEAHFATFPLALVDRCLRATPPRGGVVLDPFGGSGTVAIVAEKHGADAVLIELNPKYVEIARKRIEAARGIWADTKIERIPSKRKK